MRTTGAFFAWMSNHPTHSCAACEKLPKPALKLRLQRLRSYLWETAMNPPSASMGTARSPDPSVERQTLSQPAPDPLTPSPQSKESSDKARSTLKQKLTSISKAWPMTHLRKRKRNQLQTRENELNESTSSLHKQLFHHQFWRNPQERLMAQHLRGRNHNLQWLRLQCQPGACLPTLASQ